MYILIDNKMVVAFIYIINYKKMSFVLYLATNKRKRNKWYGSYLLNWFTENNQKRDIFVNIEEINDEYEDNILRKKKLAFYLKNKFFSTGYLSVEKDGNFDILSTKRSFYLNDYINLDAKIASNFICSVAVVTKK